MEMIENFFETRGQDYKEPIDDFIDPKSPIAFGKLGGKWRFYYRHTSHTSITECYCKLSVLKTDLSPHWPIRVSRFNLLSSQQWGCVGILTEGASRLTEYVGDY